MVQTVALPQGARPLDWQARGRAGWRAAVPAVDLRCVRPYSCTQGTEVIGVRGEEHGEPRVL
jgi:hypothetical protein